MRFFVFFDMSEQAIGEPQRRHLFRDSVSEGLHVYETPFSDTPVTPNGEQNAPGVTKTAAAVVVAVETTGAGAATTGDTAAVEPQLASADFTVECSASSMVSDQRTFTETQLAR